MRVVITGANRGLGLELARAYRAHGDVVIAGCRTPANAAELNATGAEVRAYDQASAESIAAFAAVIGDRAVDVLINNAGIDAAAFDVPSDQRSVMVLDAGVLMEVLQVNTVGPMLLTRALAPNVAAATGKVVNITSQIASMEVSQRMGRDVSYAVSKAAFNMVSVKFAVALKPDGVTVVAMHPGYLRTAMGGPGADLDPADAARQIVDTIGRLTIADTATFIRWDGSIHPW